MSRPPLAEPVIDLARATGASGEVVLRRRGARVELVVGGVFTMDTADTSTERALAALALDRLDGDRLRVVVGGLGLGYTAAALLDDPRVARVEVIELEACLVGWLADGLLPGARDPRGRPLVAGPHFSVRSGDVLDEVPALPPSSVDAVLLDVDNGPGFLVHPGNEPIYRERFLTAAARAVRSGGVVGVWSSHPAPDLAATLDAACGPCDEVMLRVFRDGRELTYAIYLARVRRPPDGA